MTQKLFYSTKEKILFWIAGYTDNSCNVNEMVEMLINNKNYFIKTGKLKSNAQINTDLILSSRRYKSMRYFWVTNVETPPEEAFKVSENWSMKSWIED